MVAKEAERGRGGEVIINNMREEGGTAAKQWYVPSKPLRGEGRGWGKELKTIGGRGGRGG